MIAMNFIRIQSCTSRYSEPFVHASTMYVACHFWGDTSPQLLVQQDLKDAKGLKVVADISCDIDDPVPCTLRPSTIADPLYGYNAEKHVEGDWKDDENILVMAVDNLPCELPKDASEDFGAELIKNVLPSLLGEDIDSIIDRASETTLEGELNSHFAYLQDYVDGNS